MPALMLVLIFTLFSFYKLITSKIEDVFKLKVLSRLISRIQGINTICKIKEFLIGVGSFFKKADRKINARFTNSTTGSSEAQRSRRILFGMQRGERRKLILQ